MSITRVWDDARAKVEEEGHCRVCGRSQGLEAAHIASRSFDKFDLDGAPRETKAWHVEPDRIVPLCGPFPQGCHGEYDAHAIDLLEHLTGREQVQAVKDCGRIETARRRLAPNEYR